MLIVARTDVLIEGMILVRLHEAAKSQDDHSSTIIG